LAVKKHGMVVRYSGEDLMRLIKEVEFRERSSLVLGDTSEPLLDLYETPDNIVIEADLPGIEPSDVEISILSGTVTVEGIKKERIIENERINYLCMERSFESFRRIVKLSMPINPNQAKAVYDRGVLTLTIPKIKDKRGVVVKVKVDRE
jgi:HSP20 family protein